LSLDKAKRFIIFDIVERLVIVRKFFRSEVSRPGFFRRGVTRLDLCTAGKVACKNDWITKSAMGTDNSTLQAFIKKYSELCPTGRFSWVLTG